MSTRYWSWIFWLFCLFCFPVLAQQNSPSRQAEVAAAVATDRQITLDVVVSDKSGHAFSGLQQQDFTLLDNKVPQKIGSFHAVEGAPAEPAVEVVLLMDEVNTSFTSVGVERQEIEKFLKQNGGELVRPVSFVFFSDSGATIGKAPSRDGKALLAELNQNSNSLRTVGRSQGVYGALDRLQMSLRAIGQLADYEATRPGRKLLVWVSPGWPLFSGPNTELDSKAQHQLFNSVVGLSDGLREARITLYNIDPLGTADAAESRT